MNRRQMRVYRIQPGRLDEFVAAWTAGVLPLRRRFGFDVDGAWSVPDDDLFVWILAWRGDGTFEEADAAYYASPDRAAVRPDPAQWIARKEAGWLSPVSGVGDGGGSAPSGR